MKARLIKMIKQIDSLFTRALNKLRRRRLLKPLVFLVFFTLIGSVVYFASAKNILSGLDFQIYYATDDAYADSQNPTQNYGQSQDLRVDNDTGPCTTSQCGTPNRQHTYMKFTVDKIPANKRITRVLLRVHTLESIESRTPRGGIVSPGHNNNWDENTLNWNNRPGSDDSKVLATKNTTRNNVWFNYEIDMSKGYINKNGTYTFVIKSDNQDGTMFHSDESVDYRPLLFVILEPEPTPTPTPEPTPTPTPEPTPTPTPSTSLRGEDVGFSLSYIPYWNISDEQNRLDFDSIRDSGAKWVRVSFIWSHIQRDGRDSWDWSTTDKAVSLARARGLKMLGNLEYTPGWANGGKDDKYPPTNPADMATFARAATLRYKDQGIKHWEVWNEPNVPSFWKPAPDPAAYNKLLKANYSAIKAADSTAQVIGYSVAHAGGTLDTQGDWGISPYRFIRLSYENDSTIRNYFDAVSVHPYPALPFAPDADKSWNTFMQVPEMYRLMQAKGDGSKKIWGTEFGYHTAAGHPEAIPLDRQAQWITDGVKLWQARSYTGPLFIYMQRDRSTNTTASEENYGIKYFNGSPKPAYNALSTLLKTTR